MTSDDKLNSQALYCDENNFFHLKTAVPSVFALFKTGQTGTLQCITVSYFGLSYNTRGYFASCVVFFRAPQGRGKMRAMSKMSASIIC